MVGSSAQRLSRQPGVPAKQMSHFNDHRRDTKTSPWGKLLDNHAENRCQLLKRAVGATRGKQRSGGEDVGVGVEGRGLVGDVTRVQPRGGSTLDVEDRVPDENGVGGIEPL